MKWLTVLTFGLAFTFTGSAQVPYTGGAGDGYACTSTAFQIGKEPFTEAKVELGMREENNNWTVLLRFKGIKTSVEVEVYAMSGQRMEHWTTAAEGNWEEEYTLQKQPGAVYIFRIKIDDQHEFTAKVLNPYHARQ